MGVLWKTPIFETTIASWRFEVWCTNVAGVIEDELSSVYSVFLPHCSSNNDAWEPIDDYELEHVKSASKAIEQGYRACRAYFQQHYRTSRWAKRSLSEATAPPFLNVSSYGVS